LPQARQRAPARPRAQNAALTMSLEHQGLRVTRCHFDTFWANTDIGQIQNFSQKSCLLVEIHCSASGQAARARARPRAQNAALTMSLEHQGLRVTRCHFNTFWSNTGEGQMQNFSQRSCLVVEIQWPE